MKAALRSIRSLDSCCLCLIVALCCQRLGVSLADDGKISVSKDHSQEDDSTTGKPGRQDPAACYQLAQQFVQEHGRHPSLPSNASQMLYFLHIPRTAGRTYHSCFLKQAHPPSKRCAKSYDVLRLSESMSSCGLLSSHDDYSVVDMLPEDGAIITQLREPVDRVLSTYEFALEVAARAAKGPRPRDPNSTKTDTRDVWPWSFLVPFLEKEIWSRLPAAKRAAEAEGHAGVQPVDPYNNDIALPLSEFLEHPEVEDVVHNGATLQVLGLTNYSMWPEAGALRQCLPKSPPAQDALLKLALERLDHFVHVGVFDRLEDSIVSLASTLDINLKSSSWSGKVPEAQRSFTEDKEGLQQKLAKLARAREETTRRLRTAKQVLRDQTNTQFPKKANLEANANFAKLKKTLANIEHEQSNIRSYLAGDTEFDWQPHWDAAFLNNYPLWVAYHYCVDGARKRNSKRRENSFKNLDLPYGRTFSFTKEARQNLDKGITQRIRDKNSMDVALYEKGVKLLEARLQEHKINGKLQTLPTKEEAQLDKIQVLERQMEGKKGDQSLRHHHQHRNSMQQSKSVSWDAGREEL